MEIVLKKRREKERMSMLGDCFKEKEGEIE